MILFMDEDDVVVWEESVVEEGKEGCICLGLSWLDVWFEGVFIDVNEFGVCEVCVKIILFFIGE